MNCHNKNYEEIILSAAKEIAIREGLLKVTIRGVADNCGISIGTVYNYFPSKSELISAIIEGFWEEAFTSINWSELSKNSFYTNLEAIHLLLYKYLSNFKVNWLDQLSMLSTQEKNLGKQRQNEYFKKIHQRIIILMDMDINLSSFNWNNVVTKDETAKFIFDNMFIRLRENHDDITFLIELLKKFLINK